VAGHEQVKVELDRQAEQVWLVPLVDPDEGLVKGEETIPAGTDVRRPTFANSPA